MKANPERPATISVADRLDAITAGVLRWIGANAAFLDSASARAELPVTPRVKAVLQLGLLCHHWARVRPGDDDLGAVVATVHRMCRHPDFPQEIAAHPRLAQPFGLMYAALAPAGVDDDLRVSTLARLAAGGFLSPRGKTAYYCLATRYYADLAGVEHDIGPYPELYKSSPLGRKEAEQEVAGLDVCKITHTVFYLSDFGFRATGLTDPEQDRALRIVRDLTDYCVQHYRWDFAAKLILAQYCLGGDPVRTPSARAGICQIAGVQVAGGAIPGRSLAEQVPESAVPLEFFRKSYQTTITTALMSLIVSAGRAAAHQSQRDCG